jgi:hypothetical protein
MFLQHIDNKPGSWSKDRIIPVQPPLNSLANASLVLFNLALGCAILLAISFIVAFLLHGPRESLSWLLLEPVPAGIAVNIAFGLQWEVCSIACIVSLLLPCSSKKMTDGDRSPGENTIGWKREQKQNGAGWTRQMLDLFNLLLYFSTE